MAVQSVGERYRCNVCGNQVKVTKVGGGALVCCGKEMELLDVEVPKPVDDEIPV